MIGFRRVQWFLARAFRPILSGDSTVPQPPKQSIAPFPNSRNKYTIELLCETWNESFPSEDVLSAKEPEGQCRRKVDLTSFSS